MKKKKVLILGVTGQDGSFMARLLLKKKYEVHGFIRKSATGNLNNIKDIIKEKNFHVHHGDLLDFTSLTKTIKKIQASEIYNFADQDHVRWSMEMPNYSFNITGASVINILEIIRNNSPKSKYFQPLSSNVFGNTKSKKQNEKEKFSPLSIYALGKVSAYYACKMYSDVYGLKIYGAIFYNHESERRPEEYVTRKITKAVAIIFYGKQKKLSLGDISIKIDWGYANDYMEAAYQIMQLKKPDFFIIGSGSQCSIKDFTRKCFSYVGLDYKKYLVIDKRLFRKGRTSSLMADTKKARRVFNYKVKTNINKLVSIMMDNDLELENK